MDGFAPTDGHTCEMAVIDDGTAPHWTVMERADSPWRYAEFRALWLGRGLSLCGDQLARVALAVLVFRRTGSPAWTAAIFALSYVPYLAGPLLASIADRRPRRTIMLTIDCLRAGAFAVMALPSVPLPATCALLFAATAISPLYDAARSATMPDTVPVQTYPAAMAVLSMTTEASQLVGFACGGILVAAFGPHLSLGLDAATFALAAMLTLVRVRHRPAAATEARDSLFRDLASATTLIFRSPRLRSLTALAWLTSLWIVPEALAVPYAASLHHGAVGVGVLLAAIPAGFVLGAFPLSHYVPHERRLAYMAPLSLLAAAGLLGCAIHPGFVVSVLLWIVCGIGTAYNVPANAAFVEALPNARRGQAFALVTTGMFAGQGLTAVLAGLAATRWSPASVVAATGALGLVFAALLAVTGLRHSQPHGVAAPERDVEEPGLLVA
jgi:MFS family permease